MTKTVEMDDFIEKPVMEEALSRLLCLGRYLLTQKSLNILKGKPEKGEIQLTDAILVMLKDGEK